MNIMMRVDASVRIGNGHVIRCLALAHELKQRGADIHFICRELTGHLGSLIERQGFPVFYLSSPAKDSDHTASSLPGQSRVGVTSEQDLRDSIEVISDHRPDWLIMDHYELDSGWQEGILKHADKLMVISDAPDQLLVCDMLLDQTFGREMSEYDNLLASSCRKLTGSRFALLRPEFAQLRAQSFEKRAGYQGVGNILIAMGGTDEANNTATVLRCLDKVFQQADVNIIAVLASNAPYLGMVRQLAEELSIEVVVKSDVSDMAEKMLWADLAIGGSGATTWERCCLGLPAIVAVVAENQKEIGIRLSELGAIELLPDTQDDDIDVICDKIQGLDQSAARWKAMSDAAYQVTDGLGARRVAVELMPPVSAKGLPVYLRPVSIRDTEQLHRWQSNPDTRRYAHNPAIPAFSEHEAWMRSRLSDGSVYTEMIMHDNEPSGVIRLDPVKSKANSIYLLSIYIAPEKYRMGLGKAALGIIGYLFSHAELRAEVHEENIASRALFTSAGFEWRDGIGYVCMPGSG